MLFILVHNFRIYLHNSLRSETIKSHTNNDKQKKCTNQRLTVQYLLIASTSHTLEFIVSKYMSKKNINFAIFCENMRFYE